MTYRDPEGPFEVDDHVGHEGTGSAEHLTEVRRRRPRALAQQELQQARHHAAHGGGLVLHVAPESVGAEPVAQHRGAAAQPGREAGEDQAVDVVDREHDQYAGVLVPLKHLAHRVAVGHQVGGGELDTFRLAGGPARVHPQCRCVEADCDLGRAGALARSSSAVSAGIPARLASACAA